MLSGCASSWSYSALCRTYIANGTCTNGWGAASVPYYVDSTGKYSLLYFGSAARTAYWTISPASGGCTTTSAYAYTTSLAVAQVTNSLPPLSWAKADAALMVYSSSSWASYSTLYPSYALNSYCAD